MIRTQGAGGDERYHVEAVREFPCTIRGIRSGRPNMRRQVSRAGCPDVGTTVDGLIAWECRAVVAVAPSFRRAPDLIAAHEARGTVRLLRYWVTGRRRRRKVAVS